MWDKLLVMFGSYLAFILVYRIFVEPAALEHDYDKRLGDVLNKDEYKVKGRFE